MVSKVNVQDQDDASANKSPVALKKFNEQALPDTDTTLPLPTPILAIQADDLQAHLSVFPNGHRGPSGDRLLAEIELELLKRGTEELTRSYLSSKTTTILMSKLNHPLLSFVIISFIIHLLCKQKSMYHRQLKIFSLL
jgi:hypothetical protein